MKHKLDESCGASGTADQSNVASLATTNVLRRTQGLARKLSEGPCHPVEDDESSPLGTPAYAVSQSPDLTSVLLQGAIGTASSISNTVRKTFPERFKVPNQWTSSVFRTSHLLLGFSQAMVITGKGTRADLLDLKAVVLRSLSKSLSQARSSAVPECVAAVLLLGSPIVCLATQDLPNGLSFEDYIEASGRGSDVCCQNAAFATKGAARERNMHWRSFELLFSRVEWSDYHASEVEPLRYLCRYWEMSVSPCPLSQVNF